MALKLRAPLVVVLIVGPAAGCDGISQEDPAPASSSGCTGELGVPQAVAEIDAFSEGLAFSDDGRLWVSTAAAVLEVLPDGTFAERARLGSALGLAADGDTLMVAGYRTGLLERMNFADATTGTVATGLTKPKFVVPAPWGGWLVANDDTETGDITHVSPGGVTTPWARRADPEWHGVLGRWSHNMSPTHLLPRGYTRSQLGSMVRRAPLNRWRRSTRTPLRMVWPAIQKGVSMWPSMVQARLRA